MRLLLIEAVPFEAPGMACNQSAHNQGEREKKKSRAGDPAAEHATNEIVTAAPKSLPL